MTKTVPVWLWMLTMLLTAAMGAAGTIVAAKISQSDESAREQHNSWESILNSIELPIFVLSRSSQKVTFANDFTSQAFGILNNQLLTLSITDVIDSGAAFIIDSTHREAAKVVYHTAWTTFNSYPTKPVHTVPIIVRYKNGMQGPARVLGFPIFDIASNKDRSDPDELLVIILVDDKGEIGASTQMKN